ncbi:uncharacterized protein PG998_000641 [Apiospora kogelbergensis]|uniref:Uncharacterized protein n=1 Tax=Apiospora kogelbergensis TaxID=1337665 RepID=A0AAW0QWQ7_9PEZI
MTAPTRPSEHLVAAVNGDAARQPAIGPIVTQETLDFQRSYATTVLLQMPPMDRTKYHIIYRVRSIQVQRQSPDGQVKLTSAFCQGDDHPAQSHPDGSEGHKAGVRVPSYVIGAAVFANTVAPASERQRAPDMDLVGRRVSAEG